MKFNFQNYQKKKEKKIDCYGMQSLTGMATSCVGAGTLTRVPGAGNIDCGRPVLRNVQTTILYLLYGIFITIAFFARLKTNSRKPDHL